MKRKRKDEERQREIDAENAAKEKRQKDKKDKKNKKDKEDKQDHRRRKGGVCFKNQSCIYFMYTYMYPVWRKPNWHMRFLWRCTHLMSKEICQKPFLTPLVPCTAGPGTQGKANVDH